MGMGRKISFVVALILMSNMGMTQALEFEGFGSVSYHKHDEKGQHANASAEYPEGFTLGGFDLYAFQQIGEQTSAFAEFIIADFEEEIELERLWIRRDINPALAFKAGLIESPLGYWNRTYHHGGQLLQDTITRPFFLRYEEESGAIFPMVSVGIELLGNTSFSTGDLSYVAIFANGMSLDSSVGEGASKIHINMLGDPGDDKLFILRTAFRFSGAPLQIGLFGMNNPVTESGQGVDAKAALGDRLVSQGVAGADFHVAASDLEMFGEYYYINNDDVLNNTGNYTASAYYVQLGYQLTEHLKPLYRYVALDMDENDPYFRYLGMEDQSHHVFGVRYDLDESNALKMEFHRMNMGGESFMHSQVQWAFLMF